MKMHYTFQFLPLYQAQITRPFIFVVEAVDGNYGDGPSHKLLEASDASEMYSCYCEKGSGP